MVVALEGVTPEDYVNICGFGESGEMVKKDAERAKRNNERFRFIIFDFGLMEDGSSNINYIEIEDEDGDVKPYIEDFYLSGENVGRLEELYEVKEVDPRIYYNS